jgi:two-component system LytT family response regulator
MIRTIIVDDESHARKSLTLLLEQQPDVEIVAEASNGIEAIRVISDLRPDLVFLDVKMPQLSGFDVLDKLIHLGINNFEVVFLTAFDKFAIKAIKYAAFDYLMKPIDEQELLESLIKFRTKDRSKIAINTELLLKQLEPHKKLKINNSNGYEYVNIDDIVYVQGDGSYSIIMMQNNVSHTVCRTLKDIFEDLKVSYFVRIHKTYIINKQFLKCYNRTTKECTLVTDIKEYKLLVSSRLIKNIL